ncbi:hypothetical protein BG262_07160 [Floricoccus penangensis]|uniref:ABC-2 transporter permease n=1 Tax=Floricoccus penangensis TaxID=1859475 RepID=A0A9Q5JFA4_9LACT|nr:ABC-2 transporter permease [Floricoccus penangensis]OFI45770.1 hypothetical protein BG262_07160 [Floricoccus penangensis]
MKGVIAKDLYEYFGNKKNLIFSSLYFIFIILGVFVNNIVIFSMIIFFYGPMIFSPNILVTTSSCDTNSGFPKMQITMPLITNNIVNGKYLLGSLSYIFSIVVSSTTVLLNSRITGMVKSEYIIYFILIIIMFSFLSMGINYPVYILFGTKSVITYILIGGTIVGNWILSAIFFNPNIIKKLTISNIKEILFIAVIVSLIISLVGYFITQYFYNKKDFE